MEKMIIKHKIYVITYLLIVFLGLTGSLVVIGYSVKQNISIITDFSTLKYYNKRPNSRNYQESYNLIPYENVHIDSLRLSYKAKNPDFKGVIKTEIRDNGVILDSTSVKIGSTDATEDYSIANLNFKVNTYLFQNHYYQIIIQIDTNMKDYYVKEFCVHNMQDSLGVISSDRILISNITYTPISEMTYGEIFYGFIPLFIIVGFFVWKLDIIQGGNIYIRKVLSFVLENGNIIILILMFIFLSIYEFYYAYVKNVFISSDSGCYLSSANAILNGYGFKWLGQSGYDSWFSIWPIGYPLMIAFVSFITGRNVYLASKILSAILVGLSLLVLYIKFRKDAWIYSLYLLNIGFLQVYEYTWSENPFCLGLLIFCLILSHIIEKDRVKFRWFVLWGLSSVFCFLCRYFGTFSFIAIGIIFIIYFGIYILIPKYRNHNIKVKWMGSIVAGIISGIFMVGYYMMNYLMAGTFSGTDRSAWRDEYTVLTKNLYDSLLREFFNATRLAIPSGLSSLSWHYKAALVALFLLVVLFLLMKYKPMDFRLAFIGIGLLYYVVFIFVRYHSSMDSFSYRFFVPASVLITIGMLGFYTDFINKYRHAVMTVVIGVLLISSVIMGYSCRHVNRCNTSYAQYKNSMENMLISVPIKSTILACDIDGASRIFRPDVNFVNETIGISDTMDDLLERYGKSDYICIKAKHVKDILFYPIYDYDKSVIDFFSEIKDDIPDEEYIVISVKERQLKDL